MCLKSFISVVCFALVNLMLLAGCVNSKGIQPAAAPVNLQTINSGTFIHNAERVAWPEAEWWRSYHDPQLDQLITTALKDSPDLKKATARIRLSTAVAEQMYANTLPAVNGNARMAREQFTQLSFIPKPWAGRFNWNNQATLGLSYDLDLWQEKKAVWSATLDETQISTAEMQEVKIALMTSIVRAYIRLATEYQLKEIAATALADLEHQISIAKRARTVGLINQQALVALESGLPTAKNKIEEHTLHIEILKNQLAALSGQGPGGGESMMRPMLSLNRVIGLPDQLPANLIGRRPDIVAAKWRVLASAHYINSAKAAFYPNINLNAFAGFQGLAFAQLFSTAGLVAGLGPALSLPIFDGGKRRANLAAQTAAYDMAVEDYNASILQALENISSELATLHSVASELENANQALDKAQQVHRLAIKQYQAGLSNYVESLQTHAAVLTHQAILAELEASKQDSYARLMLALGGGVLGETQTLKAVAP